MSLRDNSPCAAKSDESLKGPQSSIRQRFFDKLCLSGNGKVFFMETRTEISLLDQRDMQRALTRIAHEIVEGNHGAQDLALVGIRRRGVPLAQRLGAMIAGFEGVQVPVGEVDITFYRDDLTARSPQPETHGAQFPFQVDGLHLVMVDDVIYTGRTARAAMDAIMDRGRPASIKLAVLVDRGHRELPIRADYVGKNVPTSKQERIHVLVEEIDGRDGVTLHRG